MVPESYSASPCDYEVVIERNTSEVLDGLIEKIVKKRIDFAYDEIFGFSLMKCLSGIEVISVAATKLYSSDESLKFSISIKNKTKVIERNSYSISTSEGSLGSEVIEGFFIKWPAIKPIGYINYLFTPLQALNAIITKLEFNNPNLNLYGFQRRDIIKMAVENLEDKDLSLFFDYQKSYSFLKDTRFHFGDIELRGEERFLEEDQEHFNKFSPAQSLYGMVGAITETPEEVKTFLAGKINKFYFKRCDTRCLTEKNAVILGRYYDSDKRIEVYTGYPDYKDKEKADKIKKTSLNESDVKETTVHEIGHALDFALPQSVRDKFANIAWSKPFLPWVKEYKQKNSAKFVEDYGSTNQKEDFATTFEVFSMKPNKLKKDFPKRYKFFADLMKCLPTNNIGRCMGKNKY